MDEFTLTGPAFGAAAETLARLARAGNDRPVTPEALIRMADIVAAERNLPEAERKRMREFFLKQWLAHAVKIEGRKTNRSNA